MQRKLTQQDVDAFAAFVAKHLTIRTSEKGREYIGLPQGAAEYTAHGLTGRVNCALIGVQSVEDAQQQAQERLARATRRVETLRAKVSDALKQSNPPRK